MTFRTDAPVFDPLPRAHSALVSLSACCGFFEKNAAPAQVTELQALAAASLTTAQGSERMPVIRKSDLIPRLKSCEF
jgi:hypothetical protein